jgi:uncharacterized RDD family membrane protein YckC
MAVATSVRDVSPAEEPSSPYAGLVTRAIAFAFDALVIDLVAVVVAALVGLIVSILPDAEISKTAAIAVGGAVFALWAVGYFVTFWTATGQTPGNRLMQIWVVRADGSELLPRHALIRLAGIVLGVPFLVGYWPILFTERRRGLQDWMAKTVVVTAPPAGWPAV